MNKPPAKRSSPQEIQQFLERGKAISAFVEKQPRLLFAIDATASRQPTWSIASQLQQNMFLATRKLTSLSIQLCYYRGFHEFFASQFCTDSNELAREMAGVYCEGGHTQIARVLRHALKEHKAMPLRAVVFIGDAMEENPDSLCDLAGQCGLLKLPIFMFQEGADNAAGNTFRSMARLSRGAFAHFDHSSAETLAQLLGAVASYAAGGRKALEKDNNEVARLLLKQLP
ncbi:MAG: VWA domain-containing protein [Halioglobus sp.]